MVEHDTTASPTTDPATGEGPPNGPDTPAAPPAPTAEARARRTRRRAASRPAGPPEPLPADETAAAATPAAPAPAATPAADAAEPSAATTSGATASGDDVASPVADEPAGADAPAPPRARRSRSRREPADPDANQTPEAPKAPKTPRRRRAAAGRTDDSEATALADALFGSAADAVVDEPMLDLGQVPSAAADSPAADVPAADASAEPPTDAATTATRTPARRSRRKAAAAPEAPSDDSAVAAPAELPATDLGADTPMAEEPPAPATRSRRRRATAAPVFQAPQFLPPPAGEPVLELAEPPLGTASPAPDRAPDEAAAPDDDADLPTAAGPDAVAEVEPAGETLGSDEGSEAGGTADEESDEEEATGSRRRRRRRGGRSRRRRTDGTDAETDGEGEGDAAEATDAADTDAEPGDGGSGETDDEADAEETAGSRRRRRRRRRSQDDAEPRPDDPPNTVVRVRSGRGRGGKGTDEVTALKGSTRLEAKKQRRREGREAGRRRAPILTEAEFLARREAVDRVMAVRQRGDRTQIAVLEDDVLVEHYVNKASSGSLVGNVYLGRVQNVLPSMEAAFVDIGRGRNAVLYAGEVNWDAAGLDGQPRRIEFALKSGDAVLVQVTKDPMGHKGARLTSQISLPGRYLVFVPDGSMTGISRKLPDTERSRLKGILKRVMPEDAGVIVRTAAEGASEDELARDVARLESQWAEISRKAKTGNAPVLLHGEPDLAIKVVRDIFNEDVARLVVDGSSAWAQVSDYITAVAPDLADRLEKWVAAEDLFTAMRIDEQITKALDRKVWLPSGGSLVIDRTEAMTVVDVNTGKFTGQGGNLEETVTRNNLEAAEEIVRQLRLRDIGGIIVIDFIDMVLESNRDLVLRRLVECLGRDRTKHQVAEVTSLGLVQMTRKRIGQGLLEVFSVTCEACHGRGVTVSLHDHEDPEPAPRKRRKTTGVDPADVAARALAAREAEQADATEPGEPVDVVEVAEPVEPAELVEVVEVVEVVEPADVAEAAEAGEPADPPEGEPPAV